MLAEEATLRAFLARAWLSVRSGFWFIPTVMALCATGLSVLTLHLDRTVSSEWLDSLDVFYGGGTDGARAVLSTIAGSMITTAGVAFSITIVALTLASSQFGPRLLRNFIRDRGNQLVLGTFIATYLYCVLILRTVIGPRDGVRFVPHLSITTGVFLAIASLAVLIYFIHHIAVTIQADNVVAAVGAELARSVERLFPQPIGPASASGTPETHPDGPPFELASRETGYVQMVDTEALVDSARETRRFIALTVRPGDFVVAGSLLARIWPRTGITDADESLIRRACALGEQRTDEQDIEFPIAQLVEIAVRALSPGVNDPFTATACVDRLGAGLCLLAGRRFPPTLVRDAGGVSRLSVPASSFGRLVGASFEQIREYGRSSSAVMIRLLETIGRIAAFARDEEHRRVLREQVELVARAAGEKLTDPAVRERLARVHREVLEQLEMRGQS